MHLTPSDPDINTLFRKIKSNRLDLQPNFQRGEVWGLQKKQRLIDSVLRGWHIPPIHVVEVPLSKKQEVLDGQQRLVAIRDFIDNEFCFNGKFEPRIERFEKIDGKKWDDLSDDDRSEIEDFTIRVLTISDYSPGEPGELFYRLNQPTNLTAAEQRNAFFGEARQQVKDMAEMMEDLGYGSSTIGFSNSRMAFDDTIAKVLITLESGTLDKKITANVLTERYRSSTGFNDTSIIFAKNALRLLMSCIDTAPFKIKLNKATLYSWVLFVSQAKIIFDISDVEIESFFSRFEKLKNEFSSDSFVDINIKRFSRLFIYTLMESYVDRSSSRVSDTSSVKIRDFCLWSMFVIFSKSNSNLFINSIDIIQRDEKLYQLWKRISYVATLDKSKIKTELQDSIKLLAWGEK